MDHTTCPACQSQPTTNGDMYCHLADLLGHDSMGHRITRAIVKSAQMHHVDKIEDISTMDREDVLHAQNVGSIGRKLILDKIPHLLNPEGAENESIEPAEMHEYVKRMFTESQVASYLAWLKDQDHP